MKERRRETRQSAEGTIELELETPLRRVIVGNLVDISSSGFRVRHEDFALTTGDKVRYSHSGGAGAALVIWTRLFGGKVESGLYTGSAK